MERKNKFKLVKYKSKLIAASFCAIIPLITSVSAVQSNDSPATTTKASISKNNQTKTYNEKDKKAIKEYNDSTGIIAAKEEAIAKIDAIKTLTLVNGAIEPIAKKTAFDAAIAEAKKAINDATSIANVNSAKASGTKTVTSARDQLDKVILAANETQEAKVLKETITKITKDLVLKGKDYIEPVKDGTLFDKNALQKLGGNINDFPKVPENLKITYSDEEDIDNGLLNVHIKIFNLNNDNKFQEINSKINIQEIDMKKAKASKDIFITEEKFEKFNHTISKLKNREKILPSSLNSITSPKKMGIAIPNDLPKDVKIDYLVKGYDDKKGTINVEASISKKEGTAKKAEFTLEGFKKSINILKPNTNKPNSKNGVSKISIVIISISIVLSMGIIGSLIKMILDGKGKNFKFKGWEERKKGYGKKK